jgi:uncharacterized damage-inducible protein DinB
MFFVIGEIPWPSSCTNGNEAVSNAAMTPEIDDLREHLERYRAVTLQYFEILSEEELCWRPRDDAFTCGQHLLHIVQGEDFYIRGLAENVWDLERLRFPKPMPEKTALRDHFDEVRRRTIAYLNSLTDGMLGESRRPGHAPIDATLRSWLWFLVEHEIHHKAQLAEYVRALGHLPPYFGIPLPLGERPDIAARQNLGGV